MTQGASGSERSTHRTEARSSPEAGSEISQARAIGNDNNPAARGIAGTIHVISGGGKQFVQAMIGFFVVQRNAIECVLD